MFIFLGPVHSRYKVRLKTGKKKKNKKKTVFLGLREGVSDLSVFLLKLGSQDQTRGGL